MATLSISKPTGQSMAVNLPKLTLSSCLCSNWQVVTLLIALTTADTVEKWILVDAMTTMTFARQHAQHVLSHNNTATSYATHQTAPTATLCFITKDPDLGYLIQTILHHQQALQQKFFETMIIYDPAVVGPATAKCIQSIPCDTKLVWGRDIMPRTQNDLNLQEPKDSMALVVQRNGIADKGQGTDYHDPGRHITDGASYSSGSTCGDDLSIFGEDGKPPPTCETQRSSVESEVSFGESRKSNDNNNNNKPSSGSSVVPRKVDVSALFPNAATTSSKPSQVEETHSAVLSSKTPQRQSEGGGEGSVSTMSASNSPPPASSCSSRFDKSDTFDRAVECLKMMIRDHSGGGVGPVRKSSLGSDLKTDNPDLFPDRPSVKAFFAKAIKRNIILEQGSGAFKEVTLIGAHARNAKKKMATENAPKPSPTPKERAKPVPATTTPSPTPAIPLPPAATAPTPLPTTATPAQPPPATAQTLPSVTVPALLRSTKKREPSFTLLPGQLHTHAQSSPFLIVGGCNMQEMVAIKALTTVKKRFFGQEYNKFYLLFDSFEDMRKTATTQTFWTSSSVAVDWTRTREKGFQTNEIQCDYCTQTHSILTVWWKLTYFPPSRTYCCSECRCPPHVGALEREIAVKRVVDFFTMMSENDDKYINIDSATGFLRRGYVNDRVAPFHKWWLVEAMAARAIVRFRREECNTKEYLCLPVCLKYSRVPFVDRFNTSREEKHVLDRLAANKGCILRKDLLRSLEQVFPSTMSTPFRRSLVFRNARKNRLFFCAVTVRGQMVGFTEDEAHAALRQTLG